jgi:hypothetical protein
MIPQNHPLDSLKTPKSIIRLGQRFTCPIYDQTRLQRI